MIAMAESIKFTPRTKHIAIKYHHFRSRVQLTYNPTGDIRIRYINTKLQLADIFTKPVDDTTFSLSESCFMDDKSYHYLLDSKEV